MNLNDAMAIAAVMRREHKDGAEAFVRRQIRHFSMSSDGGSALAAWLAVSNALQVQPIAPDALMMFKSRSALRADHVA